MIKWQTKKPVAFEQLSKALKAEICNGCGGSDSWFKPTHAELFKPACQPHDYDYAVGGSRWDKIKADWRLRARIRQLVTNTDIEVLRTNLIMDDHLLPDCGVQQIYYRWADAYMIGVLCGGNKYFHRGPKRWPLI